MALIPYQIKMLKLARERGPSTIREIFAGADSMGDIDTVVYIAENYLDCFDIVDQEQITRRLKQYKENQKKGLNS